MTITINSPDINILIAGNPLVQPRRSSLDRVQYGMSVNELKQDLKALLDWFKFEPKDLQTLAEMNLVICNYLESCYATRRIMDYKVIADETNNTPWSRDNGILVVDIFAQLRPWEDRTHIHGEVK